MAKGAKKKEAPPPRPLRECQRFIRIVELERKQGDVFSGFQPEIIWVDGDRVVKRKVVDKPNLFEYAFTQAGELIDPRNESVGLDE